MLIKECAIMKRSRTYMVSVLFVENHFDKIAKVKGYMSTKKVKENRSTTELIGGKNKAHSRDRLSTGFMNQ